MRMSKYASVNLECRSNKLSNTKSNIFIIERRNFTKSEKKRYSKNQKKMLFYFEPNYFLLNGSHTPHLICSNEMKENT